MRRRSEELIDHLLGELSPERSGEITRRIARDPETAAERDLYSEALAVIRQAAEVGWPAAEKPRGARRLRRPALAAAAVLVVAGGLYFLSGALERSPIAIYAPDGAYGYLMEEETDAQGRVLGPGRGEGFTLRSGALETRAPGAEESYALHPGEAIAPESQIETPAESGARIDLPRGGILFLGPLSTLQVRYHLNGEAALRLMSGVACTVAGSRPIHLAVHETDLLLDQVHGAALLRASPPEAICLRGDLFLHTSEGTRFKIPEYRRIPAACADAPRTASVSEEQLGLDWYRTLVYRIYRGEAVIWEHPGLSRPIRPDPDALLYLRIEPHRSGELEVSFGGNPRKFTLRAGVCFRLRLKLRDLGPGPRLHLSPATGIRRAWIFSARPK